MSGSKIIFDSCTHTTDELRDWHAIQDGWEFAYNSWWHPTIQGIFHPYTATLDGAASAMPKGWKTLKSRGPMEMRPHWTAESVDKKITILSTEDEIFDRYLLAKKVREHISQIASQNNKMQEKTMTNEYRYEKRPVRVRAIQAEFKMDIKHPHGLNGYLTVEAGQWIVEAEGGIVEIVSDEDFRKNYRTIRPDVAIRTMPLSCVNKEGDNQW